MNGLVFACPLPAGADTCGATCRREIESTALASMTPTGTAKYEPKGEVTLSSRPTSDSTHVLVAYHSLTGRTAAVGALVAEGARAQPAVDVRIRRVDNVTCDDLRWMDGLALGSPVYYGAMAARAKAFVDRVQQQCFSWPVTELRWKAGAAFTTGGHASSGKDAVLASFHAVFIDLQVRRVEVRTSSGTMGAHHALRSK